MHKASATERILLLLFINVVLPEESSRDTLRLDLQKAFSNALKDFLGKGAASPGGGITARGMGSLSTSTNFLASLALLVSLYPSTFLDNLLLCLRKLSSSCSLTMNALFFLGVMKMARGVFQYY